MFLRVEISGTGPDSQRVKVDGPDIVLGRDPASQIPFDGAANSAVSWQHARIELSPGGATVLDLGSSNGTFINGEAAIGKKTIQIGDVIGLGQTGPKVRVVEFGLGPPALPPGGNAPAIQPTKAEKMLPHGMLTPPMSTRPLNVSSDSMPVRVTGKRKRSSAGAIVLGVLAIAAVGGAGYVVFTSQTKTEEKKDEAKKDEKKDVVVAANPEKKDKDVPPLPKPPDPPVIPPVNPPKKDPVDPKPSGPLSAAEIYRRTLLSTGWVTIQNNPPFLVTGTGALIDKDQKLFLTAYHVIEGSREAKIYFPRYDADGRPISDRGHYLKKEAAVIGEVIVGDSKRDLAVLRLRTIPEGVIPLPLASKGVDAAHDVFTVGNPGVSSGLWVFTRGTVRLVLEKKFRMDNRQEVDAWIVEAQFPINQGDSGGPVVNDRNELVAVNCSLNAKAQLFSNCIDLREIQVVLDRARKERADPRSDGGRPEGVRPDGTRVDPGKLEPGRPKLNTPPPSPD